MTLLEKMQIVHYKFRWICAVFILLCLAIPPLRRIFMVDDYFGLSIASALLAGAVLTEKLIRNLALSEAIRNLPKD